MDVRSAATSTNWMTTSGAMRRWAELDLPFLVVWLSKWEEAKAPMTSTSWENAKLEATNDVTVWLNDNAHDAYQSSREGSRPSANRAEIVRSRREFASGRPRVALAKRARVSPAEHVTILWVNVQPKISVPA
jgi:hypothetical protein